MSQSRKENASSQEKPKPTLAQSMLNGSVAGATEILTGNPCFVIKNRIQTGQPFTLNPSVLYAGALENAVSMAPITAIQLGLNNFFQNTLFNGVKELSPLQKISSAFAAGVGSSFVSCPTEMILIYQDKVNKSFYDARMHLITHAGWRSLYTGLPAIAMRDAMFTAFFLGVRPVLKNMFQPYYPNSELAASISAGMIAGVGATLCSQTADTIKTIQQASIASESNATDLQQPLNAKQAINTLYSKYGAYGFFKGGIARGVRVMGAVTIMGIVNEGMETIENTAFNQFKLY